MSVRPERYGHPLPTLLLYTLTSIALALIAQPLLPVVLPSHLLQHFNLPPPPAFPALQACLGFSILTFVGSLVAVPAVSAALMAKGIQGRDLLKPGGRVSGPMIPECLGLPIACLYILLMMLFIPFPFSHMFNSGRKGQIEKSVGRECFPTSELTLYLSSLLSLMVATLLGFIDDLFDIRWRHKLPIPLIAAIPTLVVYYSEGGLTSVVLPKGVGRWIETLGWGGWVGSKVIDLGPLYYIYLLLLPTFTTNSINILAGVNGVECIQALIIAASVLLNDLLFLPLWPRWLLVALGGIGDPDAGKILAFAGGEMVQRHLMSAYFMGPMVGVCAGFLWHNWYPAKAFPGDTFCYFTGMAFSAVALQGHFSKTLILFFVPQIFNFILSCPQLFHLVECPRHRLPHYETGTNLLHPSRVIFAKRPAAHTRLVLSVLEILGLVRLERAAESPSPSTSEGSVERAWTAQKGDIVSSTNLTILNFLLVRLGPMREDTLCSVMGGVQVGCSALAFWVRYGLGAWVYGGDRR
ncbi:putative UDP-N-acetylglucosamine-dolichyl-phosphate N-acetylglucosaminephosphotransferase [Dioszegia hungarica]|uniref:UDP-N-acetylglucosamine--dolichyl-phosphate N-acetylglucosaminephosphotransferase n=1 Tax=Dioszegia hungarica TaxID=4972 RepID=A0AA38H7M1_9TREE|nr:putative UDP-N-acetylglucosamine-dolichyl-phosphate N-acetylglucosaminephosphotransferase [Dioszegia hungarica]KAI9635723.1 putative UDP-N-acetylglucosamine-dolichyl-phosphate N-acetylglucosaminephosphotransferase [Dioszegia hungarica]